MKNIFKYMSIAVAAATLTGCSDFLDKKSPSISSDGYFETEMGVCEATNAVYVNLFFNGDWGAPTYIEWDNWSPYGRVFREETQGLGSGYGITPDNGNISGFYGGAYRLVARANSVIAGNNEKWLEQSDDTKRFINESRVLRAFGFNMLVSMFGDIIMPLEPVSPDQYEMPATPKEQVADFIIKECEEAAEYLPWTPGERGRVTKGFAYGLAARTALTAAGFNYGGKEKEYYALARDYAKKIIDSKQYTLSPVFMDLFKKEGQAKPETQKELIMELMFCSEESYETCHYGFQTCGPYAGGGAAQDAAYRTPSNLLVDLFECKDGLRIDESPLYNPKKPYQNRDPRMRWTLAMHGDTIPCTTDAGKTISLLILNVYDANCPMTVKGRWKTTPNLDVTSTANNNSYVKAGEGYIWRKYAEDCDRFGNNHNQNIVLMRYAETLLTYAEAKIELGELDQSVYDAINLLRRRANMPDFDVVKADRKGDQDKMRQIVRRERKAELAWEGLLLTDYRRWDIGDLLCKYPRYCFPLPEIRYEGLTADDKPNYNWSGDGRSDLNDVPSYEAYKEKLTIRSSKAKWDPKYRYFPYPQSEVNKCPQLENVGW